MKKLIIAIILLVSLSASSCGFGLTKLTVNTDGSVSDADGVTYKYCSVSVSPIKAGDKYGRASGGYTLFTVDGLEPSKWLCEGEDAISLVYAVEGIEHPDLTSFEPDGALMRISVDDKLIDAGKIEDTQIISNIVQLFESVENAPLPSAVSDVIEISFTSAKYPGLYYTVQHLTGSDGKNYIRDRGAERCVLAEDVLGLNTTEE